MDVLLAGGTGFIGRNLCSELTDRGHNVTALARDPDPKELPDGVETVMGDVTAYDSIEPAFSEQDVVVNLVALSPLFRPSGGDEMHDRIHRGGTENCLRAAKNNDVDRFVQMSALGADPDGSTHYIRAKGRAEQLVRESDLEWAVLRPSVVFGDGGEFISFTRKLTPPVVAPLPGGGKTKFQPIYVGDLVEIVVATIEDETHTGRTYDIGGPQVLRLADIAKLTRNASGGSVSVLPVPMAAAEVGLKLAGLVPGSPLGADQYRSLQLDNTTDDNDITAFGIDPAELTRLPAYLGVDET